MDPPNSIDIKFQVEHCSNDNADNVNMTVEIHLSLIMICCIKTRLHFFNMINNYIPVTIRQTTILIVWNWHCCAWYFSYIYAGTDYISLLSCVVGITLNALVRITSQTTMLQTVYRLIFWHILVIIIDPDTITTYNQESTNNTSINEI